jgi:hypothetical protein
LAAPEVLLAEAPEPRRWIPVNVVSYVEQEYTLKVGDHYDRRPLSIPERQPEAPRRPNLPQQLADLDSSFDIVTTSAFDTYDADLAVGPSHVIAVNSAGVFGFLKDGTSVLTMSLGGFFASLSPSNPPSQPQAFYDEFWGRYVVMANDTDGTSDSDLLVAVSASGDPTGAWHQVKVFTMISNFDPDGPGGAAPSPHWGDFPRVGMEGSQIYVSFLMRQGLGEPGGTAVWNIWKWGQTDPTPMGGLYDGETTTNPGTCASTIGDKMSI